MGALHRQRLRFSLQFTYHGSRVLSYIETTFHLVIREPCPLQSLVCVLWETSRIRLWSWQRAYRHIGCETQPYYWVESDDEMAL